MNDLKEVWTLNGLLADTNGDGVPDAADVRINGIEKGCCPLGIIDFCARLGLETTGLSFPLMNDADSGAVKVCLKVEGNGEAKSGSCILHRETSQVEMVADSEETLSGLLRWLSSSWPYVSEDLPNDPVTRIDVNHDGFQLTFAGGASRHRYSFDANDESVDEEPLSSTAPFNGLADIWTVEGFYQAGRVDVNSRLNVQFAWSSAPSPAVLKKAAEFAARMGLHATGIRFPLTGELHSSRKPDLRLIMKSSEELTTEVCWERNTSGGIDLHVSGDSQSMERALAYFASARSFAEGGTFGSWERIREEKDESPLLVSRTWEDQGETADLWDTLETWSRENERFGQHVGIRAFVSEPCKIREELSTRISQLLAGKADQIDVHVRSAFKPGFHWIEEDILPRLKGNELIGKIKILCKRHDYEKGLELPIRWMQELYPIDQLLSHSLSIETDDIEMSVVDDQDETYQLIAVSQDGTTLLSESLSVPTVELDYIDGEQKVYPTTGEVELFADGERLHVKQISTDRERFWLFFKDDVLPSLSDVLPLSEEGRGIDYPFFEKMILDVDMSEEERKLGIDEERISSLEALHEDIYFNTLDYFVHLGKARTGREWVTPGGIYPFMHVKEGETPKAQIQVYGLDQKKVPKVSTRSLVFTAQQTEPVSCELTVCRGDREKKIRRTREEWQDQILSDELDQVKELQNIDGIFVWLGGMSFGGNPIPVVELTKPYIAEFMSPHKLALYKPTILIETGHHANEVSSMPAIEQLLKEIAVSRQQLLDRVNLVVIPRANPDGVRLHQEMAKDNPEWKHHAARYNAVGLEYSWVRYQDSVFGEGNVFPKIVHRWLPDVIIDDHGIPSHEWTQPFAGYNSPPRFPQSFWMPISFFYGIARRLDDGRYPEHAKMLDHVMERITENIQNHHDIHTKNKQAIERYEQYGHRWLPEIFPLDQKNGMIFYQWDTETDDASTATIARYPQWCTLDLITEAADETVYGESLEQCIKAHQLFDEAVIETIASTESHVLCERKGKWIQYKRKRPLTLTEH